MSHKVYPNLAHLDSFPYDLNYTGIILDGWNHPVNLVPVVLTILYLVTMGIPRNLVQLWILFNGCIIHSWMDGIIGVYGVGPQYLVDEYAVLDARYWVVQDPAVMMISLTEFFIMAPLCIPWYYAARKQCWTEHFYGIVVSILQITGTIVYVGAEWWEGHKHMPAVDSFLSPTFDTYEKMKYFWGVFVCLNGLWIVFPTFVTWRAYKALSRIISKQQAKKKN